MAVIAVASFTWFGARMRGSADQPAQARPADWPKGAGKGTPESIAAALDEIETLQATVRRDRTDLQIIAATASNPTEIFEWIRTQTSLVPYEGSLRGPLGVLMDRRGNSLDRALLAAKLLEMAGFETRIASTTLEPGIKAVSGAVRAAGNPAEARNPLGQQARNIASAILNTTGPLPLRQLQAESAHQWAQYLDGERWADLDPSAAGIGQRLAGSDTKVLSAAEIEGQTHTVDLRLVAERWERGRLTEIEIMTVPFGPVAAPLGSATFSFLAVDPTTHQVVERNFTAAAELRSGLLRETAWIPVLVKDHSIVESGPVFDEAGQRAAPNSSKERPTTSTVLTALTMDYHIKKNGSSTRRVRRYIFDSIGPEARRIAAPLPRPTWSDTQRVDRGADLAAIHDTLVTFASLPSDEYVSRFADRVIAARDPVLQVANGSTDEATLRQAAEGLSFRSLELYAAVRDADLHPGLALVEPQIVRRVIRSAPDSTTDEVNVQVSADLAWNRLGRSSPDATATDIVTQGVLDTLNESAVVLDDETPAPAGSTAALFDAARTQKVDIVVIREKSDKRLPNLPGPARARVLADLDAGHLVVVPARPILVDGRSRLGWWRVDPQSGHTVGAMDTGLLQVTVDYQVTVNRGGIKIIQFRRIKVGPAARAWADRATQLRTSTTMRQYNNLLGYAQETINATGKLPSLLGL